MKLTTSSAAGATTASNHRTQHFVNEYGTFPVITTDPELF